jgi:hypothetical protein
MTYRLPYDIHEYNVSTNIKSYADFARYLTLVNNYDEAKMLIAKFGKTIGFNSFFQYSYLYCDGTKVEGEAFDLAINIVSDVIKFHPKIKCLSIFTLVFDPAHYVNYVGIDEIKVYAPNAIDWKCVSNTFPNVRKMMFANMDQLKDGIVHFPKLALVRVNSNPHADPAFFAKYRNIEFTFKISSPEVIDEPNVKFFIDVELSKIAKFFPIAHKIREMGVTIDEYGGDDPIPVPNVFCELTHLVVYNINQNDLTISGFPNLECLLLVSRKEFGYKYYLSNVPHLRRIINRGQIEIVRQ